MSGNSEILMNLQYQAAANEAATKEAAAKIKYRLSLPTEKVDFPTDAFPPLLRDMIKAYCNCYGSEPAHYGLTALTLAGVCIGNSVWIQERSGSQPAMLYSAIVDLPGRGKTPIIETFMKPLYRIESDYRKKHADGLLDFKIAQNNGDEEKRQPSAKELIINNFTVESVHKVLSNNPRGIVSFKDELAGWISGMDAYKQKGQEEQFWLELWNGGMLKVNRKGSDQALYIDNVFCAVIGGTQPGVIDKFGQGNKGLSGFLARPLYSYPEVNESSRYNRSTPSENYGIAWSNMVEILMDLPVRDRAPEHEFDYWKISPIMLRLSPSAQKEYIKFYDFICEEEEGAADDEVLRSMVTKHKSHCLRIALILHFLDYADKVNKIEPNYERHDLSGITPQQVESMSISSDCMKRAIKINRYFLYTSLKVVGKLGSPVDRLKPHIKVWYEELPDPLIKANAVDLGKTAGMSARTVARYLNNEYGKLFKRIGKGHYEKLSA